MFAPCLPLPSPGRIYLISALLVHMPTLWIRLACPGLRSPTSKAVVCLAVAYGLHGRIALTRHGAYMVGEDGWMFRTGVSVGWAGIQRVGWHGWHAVVDVNLAAWLATSSKAVVGVRFSCHCDVASRDGMSGHPYGSMPLRICILHFASPCACLSAGLAGPSDDCLAAWLFASLCFAPHSFLFVDEGKREEGGVMRAGLRRGPGRRPAGRADPRRRDPVCFAHDLPRLLPRPR